MTITLEDIQAEHSRLAHLIAKLSESATQPSAPILLIVAEATITLQHGEHYAGPVLDAEGNVTHHLVLMSAQPSKDLSWDAAVAWAKQVGGDLPTRQEQALLFANCKPHLKEEWHWSCEEHASDASYAWRCYLRYGTQDTSHKSAEGAVVAVRRINP